MKPQVICLMACSVDGRTLPSRWRPKGAAANHFEQVHEQIAGDAWLIGRVTGQEFAKGKPYPASTKETFPREHGSHTAMQAPMGSCSTLTAGSPGVVPISAAIRSSWSFPRQSRMRILQACAAKGCPIFSPEIRA